MIALPIEIEYDGIRGHMFSNYMSIKKCTECDWFALHSYSIHDVCPDCGAKLTRVTARHLIRIERKGSWPFRYDEEVKVAIQIRPHEITEETKLTPLE